MGPRKKPSSSSSSKKPSSSPSSKSKKPSSSKKPNLNQQAQPSKFGIQYFFERQTQNAVLNSQKPRSPDLPSIPNKEVSTFHDHKNAAPDPNYPTLPHRNLGNALKSQANEQINAVRNIRSALRLQRKSSPSEDSAVINPRSVPNSQTAGTSNTNSTLQKSRNALDTGLVALNNANSEPQNPNNASNSPATDPNNPSQVTPPSDLPAFAADAAVVELESSPEIPKSVSLKRFKFSPGMLIKQSQDEGGDEVTWKISPVNQRLKVVSKSMPGMVRMLADASRLNSLSFRHCSKNKMSLDSEGKLEKWLSSPTLKATERSMTLANKVGLKRVNPDQHMDLNGNGTDMNTSSRVSQQSPFRTPPSLSYCNDKPTNGEACNGASQQLGFRQHKKALLELLDQVEDVISVEESVPIDKNSCSFNIQDTSVEMDPNNTASKGPSLVSQEKVNRASSSPTFLVLEVSQKHRYDAKRFKVLRLLNEQSGEERAVYLWDQWFNSVVAPGDTIHVTGDFDDQGKCDVDQDNNLLIVHPDILLSGTRIAGSSSCLRRTVLDERLKCSEHSTPALLGTLLHQIFQAGLVREIPTKTFLEEYARIVLQKNVQSLYACGVNENVIYKTLIEAVPKILNWIALFRDSQDLKAPTVDFKSNGGLKKVKISEVMDIEEMAWAPKYGLKGMIDASVLVKVVSDTKEPNEKIMPLEFKTGKATSGQSNMEHCAQVILYTLLMSERYLKPIDAGLLYYLYTDQTQGIVVRRLDLITLIMRRNELANDIRKASRTQQLPPMLQNSSICKGCRHLNVCTIYHKAHGGSTDSSGLGNIFDSHIRHLTNGHCVFLRHWDHLIDLEYKEMQAPKKDIGRHSLKSDHSSSISSVILDTSDRFPVQKTLKENQFIYHFVRQNLLHLNVKAQNRDCSTVAPSATNDFDCTLRSGDYVTLSSESSNITVASGVITNITHNHVSVSFNKRLRLPWTQSSLKAQDLLREVWRIDKDEFSTSFAVMRFNLVQLFVESEQSSHLRAMIVDLEVPRFDSGCIVSQDPAIFYVWSQKNLNNDQRRAILKILTAKDYALILGMPGTGKTSTMVHAVKALLIRGTTILLTSYTNSAVDNLLIKLKFEGIDFVRIGRPEAVHEEVRGNCISAMDLHSVDDIKLRLDQVQVVAVTCLGITNPLLANKKFDVCIMDEAGQTTLPVSLGPLMRASMFVLVGDHYQLPPLVQSAEARENGMGVSLFCRLSEAHPQAVSALQSQYRMCQGIMELSNALIYGDRLHCGSTEISNAKLKFSSFKSISPWLKKVLDPIRPVIFINTDGLPASEARDNKTVNNLVEASIIGEVTNELLNNGIQGEDIGIITPYNSQANLVRQSVQTTSVEINTIDKYQGRDKDCILVSFVRSTENPKNCNSSLLGDWHRINVAITRPKKKLIMVGSCKTLSRVPLLKLLIEKVDDQLGLMNVSDKDISYKGKMKRCSKLDTSVFQD